MSLIERMGAEADKLDTLATVMTKGKAKRAEAADVIREAKSQLEAMQAEIESKDKRIQAVRDCIERGYPTIGKTDKCPHDRFGFEDCVACYDEALLAALDGLHSQESAK